MEPTDEARQSRVLGVVTLGLVAVGVPFVVQYWWLGVPWMSAAVAATALGGLANLARVRSGGSLRTGSLVASTLLFALLVASNIASGGFYDPNFGWLYVVPVAAALLVDARAGWVFTGLVLLATVVFWGVEEAGWAELTPQIPEAGHAAQSLANRVSAVVAIGITLAALASRDRARQAQLERANEQLRLQMLEQERMHGQLTRVERLAAIGEMAASVGHEVNNPLTYVLANLELLQEEPGLKEGEAAIMLGEALDGSRRVRDIVSNLRALSREPSAEPLTPVPLADAVSRALILVPRAVRNDVSFELEVDPALQVLAREGPLVQIVSNLMANAAHALRGRDDATVWVRVRASEHTVVLEVEDNGPGVQPEAAERIFEPFFTTRDGFGTGLGLSIGRSLAEAMSGHLTLARVGPGACFQLELPRAEPRPSERPRGGLRLLVVDDDEAVLRALKRSLTEHEVVTAAGAEAALACWEAGEFDCVLCDVMMPGVTGIELVDALEGHSPGTRKRVVFMTGAVVGELDPDALARAGARTMAKPLDLAVLRRTLAEVARA